MDLPKKLQDAVLRAEAKGWSRARIAKECGIAQPNLQRFVANPDHGLRIQSAQKLMDFFAMNTTPPIIPPPPED